MPFDIIKSQLPNIPKSSGVYKFIDSKETVLYVGKAKNLFKRVSSYMNKNSLSNRIIRMITLAHKVEYIITKSEVEALLLEHNLIKKLSPNFNILLKDDKTFPQILISNHRFPQISKYRGLKNNKGQYFGPYVYAGDVNRTIEIIRKNFQLRSCSDQEFKIRTKPCLEYQIKKCSAPCVGYISASDYAENVKNSVDVLTGKSQQVQEIFRQQMLDLSKKMEYEKALILRDKIKSLDSIQTKQNINFDHAKNIDVIVASEINSKVCIYISFYRLGQNYGARPYFYEIENDTNVAEVLSGFIGQFYLSENPPAQLIIDREVADKELLEQYLCAIIKKKIEIIIPKQGDKFNLVKDNQKIAWQILDQKISHNLSTKKLLLELKKLFDLAKVPQRIEVYDNSHTSFDNAVGAMITAGADGFIKSGYRKFNIKNEIADGHTKFPADDTQMLKQVLFRRFSKLQKKDLPDFIIIDGGKGQLSSASEIFENLGIKTPFVCMSKGKNRNAGEEFFHQVGKESFTLEKNSPIMHYLQRLRDEAHRFAIMTHRKKRDKDFLKN
ncbi:MAG: excinuclease ABC subunit UvrC [Alphaproteobacteria bacterium]|nr:excinuclease ABC subunit UvrC [Alphaproteobacteria bacterium]